MNTPSGKQYLQAANNAQFDPSFKKMQKEFNDIAEIAQRQRNSNTLFIPNGELREAW